MTTTEITELFKSSFEKHKDAMLEEAKQLLTSTRSQPHGELITLLFDLDAVYDIYNAVPELAPVFGDLCDCHAAQEGFVPMTELNEQIEAWMGSEYHNTEIPNMELDLWVEAAEQVGWADMAQQLRDIKVHGL